MNLEHASARSSRRGFTDRQARFLVLVARHSGVCVMRQYSSFAGIVFGHKTRKFFTNLERLGLVSTYDCAHNRGRIYHVRHRAIYEAIGEPDSRLRRPPTVPRALERLMLLDVILKEPDLVWLATPEEKMTHVSVFTSISRRPLPQMTTPQGSYEPVRYFPDHAPIGIHPRWPVDRRLPADAGRQAGVADFPRAASHVPRWSLDLDAPRRHPGAHGRPRDCVRRRGATKGLRWRFDGQFRDDLVWYFEARRAGGNPDSVPDDDERATRARGCASSRASGSRRSTLSGSRKGDDVFPTVAARVGDALFREAATIEPLVLPHAYSHLAPLVGVG